MTNVLTKEEMNAFAVQMGEEAGKGGDTQIKSLLKLVEAGYHGTYDLTPNKHGVGTDDAVDFTQRYIKAQGSTAIFDKKALNTRVQISKFRTGIKLGGYTKGGQGEPVATVNNFVSHWLKLKKVPANAKRLDDAQNAFLKFARAQLKRDTMIEPAEFDTFAFKPAGDLATAEDIISAMVKQLDKLIDGKAAKGTVQSKTQNTLAARQALRSELSAIAKARGKALGPAPQAI
jgi:hypothetical protein